MTNCYEHRFVSNTERKMQNLITNFLCHPIHRTSMPKMFLLDYFLNRVMFPSREFLKKGCTSHSFMSVSLAGIGLWEHLSSESIRNQKVCYMFIAPIPSEFAFKMHIGYKNKPKWAIILWCAIMYLGHILHTALKGICMETNCITFASRWR